MISSSLLNSSALRGVKCSLVVAISSAMAAFLEIATASMTFLEVVLASLEGLPLANRMVPSPVTDMREGSILGLCRPAPVTPFAIVCAPLWQSGMENEDGRRMYTVSSVGCVRGEMVASPLSPRHPALP